MVESDDDIENEEIMEDFYIHKYDWPMSNARTGLRLFWYQLELLYYKFPNKGFHRIDNLEYGY